MISFGISSSLQIITASEFRRRPLKEQKVQSCRRVELWRQVPGSVTSAASRPPPPLPCAPHTYAYHARAVARAHVPADYGWHGGRRGGRRHHHHHQLPRRCRQPSLPPCRGVVLCPSPPLPILKISWWNHGGRSLDTASGPSSNDWPQMGGTDKSNYH